MIIYNRMQVLVHLSLAVVYAGDAVLMIEHIEKIGKIEQTGDYHIYRIKDSDSPNTQGGAKLQWLLIYKNNEVVGANFFFKLSC